MRRLFVLIALLSGCVSIHPSDTFYGVHLGERAARCNPLALEEGVGESKDQLGVHAFTIKSWCWIRDDLPMPNGVFHLAKVYYSYLSKTCYGVTYEGCFLPGKTRQECVKLGDEVAQEIKNKYGIELSRDGEGNCSIDANDSNWSGRFFVYYVNTNRSVLSIRMEIVEGLRGERLITLWVDDNRMDCFRRENIVME